MILELLRKREVAFMVSVLGMVIVYGIEPWFVVLVPVAILLLLFVTYPGFSKIGPEGMCDYSQTGFTLVILSLASAMLLVLI